MAIRGDWSISWARWAGTALVLIVSAKTLMGPRQGVYPIFARAARAWIHQAELYASPPPGDQSDRFVYSPLVATALIPWSCLPDPVGGLLWRWGGLVFFLAAWRRWATAWQAQPGSFHLRPGHCLLLMLPLIGGSFDNGQANLWVTGFLMLATCAVREQRWNWAAAWIAAAVLFKVYPLAYGLLLVTLYPRQVGGRLVLALGVGVAWPFLLNDPIYAWSQTGAWWQTLLDQDRTRWLLDQAPRNFLLLTRWAGAPLSPMPWLMLQVCTGAFLAGQCWLGRRQGWSEERLQQAAFAWACAWMIAFGPATESTTFALLAPALIMALAQSSRPTLQPRLLAWTIYALLSLSALLCWFPWGKGVAAVLQPWAGMLFFAERLGFYWTLQETQVAAPPKLLTYQARIRPVLAKELEPCAIGENA